MKKHALFRCACGWEGMKRPSDVLSTDSRACPTCAWKNAQQQLLARPGVLERLAAQRRAAAQSNRKDPRVVAIRKRCESAKNRCQCPTNAQFPSYGGRGIEFRFASAAAMTEWIIDTLGFPPTPTHSIDRIDNNGHYEAGNIRWATGHEQNSNKRRYRRTDTGERICRLLTVRDDVTYETLRTWINKGMTDEQILARRKYQGSGVRHP